MSAVKNAHRAFVGSLGRERAISLLFFSFSFA